MICRDSRCGLRGQRVSEAAHPGPQKLLLVSPSQSSVPATVPASSGAICHADKRPSDLVDPAQWDDPMRTSRHGLRGVRVGEASHPGTCRRRPFAVSSDEELLCPAHGRPVDERMAGAESVCDVTQIEPESFQTMLPTVPATPCGGGWRVHEPSSDVLDTLEAEWRLSARVNSVCWAIPPFSIPLIPPKTREDQESRNEEVAKGVHRVQAHVPVVLSSGRFHALSEEEEQDST